MDIVTKISYSDTISKEIWHIPTFAHYLQTKLIVNILDTCILYSVHAIFNENYRILILLEDIKININ